MVVRRTGDDAEAIFLHAFAERLGVADDLLLVGLEFGPERFADRDRLGGDDVHERPALGPRKYQGVELLVQVRMRTRQYQAPARTPQGLVRRRRHDVGIRHGIRVNARGDESRDMRHVDHEIGADRVGDRTEARPVDGA